MPDDQDASEALSFEAASRFLGQATFGPTPASVAELQEAGLEAWFLDQAALPRRPMLARFQTAPKMTRHYVYPLFWEGAIHGGDQLRQRVAYVLSRIVVVSLAEAARWPDVFVTYADHLAEQAFGNYADLLRAVTYSPAMGLYLSHLGNEKADPATGSAPDENYARELMQLFTIGTRPLAPDGTALPGDAYGTEDVEGLAAIMTGLSWSGLDRYRVRRLKPDDPRRLRPMDAYPAAHEQGVKRFLGYEAEGANPIEAIDGALAHLMAHPNTPPFVCRRLIQGLVTSNPSPAYVRRVADAFAEGRFVLPSGRRVGDGRRGAMVPALAAILFDIEARVPARLSAPGFGRLCEPTQRFARVLRAFRAPYDLSTPLEPVGPLTTSRLQAQFAEQPWYAPSVFGSFSPDYAAAGSGHAAAGLVSPEMQAQNAASALGYLDRVGGLVRRTMPGPLAADFSPLAAAVEAGPAATADLLSRRMFHDAMPQATRAAITDALARYDARRRPQNERTQQQRMQLALGLAMTAPSFAVQR